MTNDQSPPRKTFPMQIPTAFTEQQQQQHKQMNMHMQSPPYPRFPTTSNSYRERSQSLSTPPPSLILPTSIPLTASPVMPFLPTLSMPSDSISMSPGRGSKHWPIDPDNIIPPTTTSFAQKNQKAVNNAIAAEKARVKEMERKENEADLSISDLKLILKRERSRSTKIIGELTLMKSISVASQAEAEVCEEGRINGLMRRVDCLQKEKGRIILELEREEEMLTNNLQRKLNEVRREKSVLEKQIIREHSFNLELKAKLDAKANLAPRNSMSVLSVDSISSLKSDEHENMNMQE